MSRSLATVFLAAVLVTLSLSPSFLQAQIPRIISYQGVLTDTTGHPKPDGTYSFTFALYAVATNGLPIWSETKSLPIHDGLFATLLGDHVAFPDAVGFDKSYWLSVQVGNDLLSPRLQFSAVAYSLNSTHASHSDTSSYAASATRADTALFAMNAAATFGSATTDLAVVENYNNIVALGVNNPVFTSGLTLRNNTASGLGSSQNSPALTFSATSWNPTSSRSEISTWSLHRWGFSTGGTSGAVLAFTVQRPDPLTITPVAFDEGGRVLLGHTKPVTTTYLGFRGEDFGQWNVILAGPTVVGWPENNIASDFRVTGATRIDGGLTVGSPEKGGKSDLRVTGNTTTDGFISSSHNAGLATLGVGDSVVVFIDGLTTSAGAVATFAGAPTVNNPIFTDNIQAGQLTFKSMGNNVRKFWYWIVAR
ncbi:MAG: hypothetical protein NTZ35_09985 [Ignavibacteriales bacterium]|nr:hypothetical protein [Ignavibacteriales bacterium]